MTCNCERECECRVRSLLAQEAQCDSNHALLKVSIAVLACFAVLLGVTTAQSLQFDARGSDTATPAAIRGEVADQALQGQIDVLRSTVEELQKKVADHTARLVSLEGILFRLEGGGGVILLVLAVLNFLQLRENKKRRFVLGDKGSESVQID